VEATDLADNAPKWLLPILTQVVLEDETLVPRLMARGFVGEPVESVSASRSSLDPLSKSKLKGILDLARGEADQFSRGLVVPTVAALYWQKRVALLAVRHHARVVEDLSREGVASDEAADLLETMHVEGGLHVNLLWNALCRLVRPEEMRFLDPIFERLEKIERRLDVADTVGSYLRSTVRRALYQFSNPRHSVTSRSGAVHDAIPSSLDVFEAMGPGTGVLEEAA